MKLATTVEVSISEFWEMTPAELNIVAESYWQRKKDKRKEDIEIAYYNSMWTIQWLGKNHPKPLKEILDGLYKEKKVMSDDEMLNQAMLLNKLFGGEEV